MEYSIKSCSHFGSFAASGYGEHRKFRLVESWKNDTPFKRPRTVIAQLARSRLASPYTVVRETEENKCAT